MSRQKLPHHVVVLGGAGYLGSVLVPQLLAANIKVRVLDSMLFGDESLHSYMRSPGCELIRGDIRNLELVHRVMRGADAVIHLAAIVGDGVCDENRNLAIEVNRDATASLVAMSKKAGVRRFIFASSCSVYGNSECRVGEEANLRPLSLYAEMKVDAERVLLASISQHFAPTVLRLGTLFGFSKRMRFDLVINQLVASAMASGLTTIFGGDQWRPFLHVEDAARAFVACLFHDAETVAGQIFNTGAERLNHRIREIGDAVVREIPSTKMFIEDLERDARSYHVSFARIEEALNFRCKRDLAFGLVEIREAIRSGRVLASQPQYYNHLALQQLVQQGDPAVQLWHERPHATTESTRAA
jgi:nucleoside-diphosphate-sugar epimerase